MWRVMEIENNKIKLPRVGARIIKSAIAVALCFFVDYMRDGQGFVFYSQLSALWCMQIYRTNTIKNALQRTIGTAVGAIYGLLFILMANRGEESIFSYDAVRATVISLMIVAVIYTTVLIKKKQASYFSCVVFLSIVINHMGDFNPYLFVWNRFLDTMIGILIGIGVNDFKIPARKRKDTLFISTLDDTLLNRQEKMSDFSRVELNRMIDDGLNFTIATMRTPAMIAESMRDIKLKYPVIAMDGAVLYDTESNRYIKSYVISASTSAKIREVLEKCDSHYYTNIVVNDSILIYFKSLKDQMQFRLLEDNYVSPYRNYINRPAPADEDVLYFMCLETREKADEIYKELQVSGQADKLKICIYESDVYKDYWYIKIFNKNASMKNMTEYLTEYIGIKKVISLGTIEGKYDITVDAADSNQAVESIRKLYEIPFYVKKTKDTTE